MYIYVYCRATFELFLKRGLKSGQCFEIHYMRSAHSKHNFYITFVFQCFFVLFLKGVGGLKSPNTIFSSYVLGPVSKRYNNTLNRNHNSIPLKLIDASISGDILYFWKI